MTLFHGTHIKFRLFAAASCASSPFFFFSPSFSFEARFLKSVSAWHGSWGAICEYYMQLNKVIIFVNITPPPPPYLPKLCLLLIYRSNNKVIELPASSASFCFITSSPLVSSSVYSPWFGLIMYGKVWNEVQLGFFVNSCWCEIKFSFFIIIFFTGRVIFFINNCFPPGLFKKYGFLFCFCYKDGTKPTKK